ncbi:phasin family protein [Anaeromyxobacter oryzae]|uniref:Uncharacterized protein n=1 Tax=Anaeromyxobacter oryzae TaxID=2918170 RepID=A0ABM7WYV3_9BACT|nr:phasin family protein [Anaeromyxobacter oryzae]BDG04665.1 hypothetical protein AMOR_36610 [Anaeromyxobacter oryzae]
MRLEDVLRNPVLKRALAAGEEGMGKVVGKLLASDRVTTGLSSLVTSAMQARETFERGVQQALHAANLPSRDDVASLKRKLEELESMIDGLSARVDAPPAAARARHEADEPDDAA